MKMITKSKLKEKLIKLQHNRDTINERWRKLYCNFHSLELGSEEEIHKISTLLVKVQGELNIIEDDIWRAKEEIVEYFLNN